MKLYLKKHITLKLLLMFIFAFFLLYPKFIASFCVFSGLLFGALR